MLTYCLKRRKDTKNRDAKMIQTKNGRLFYHQNVLPVAVKNQDL